MCVVKAQLVPDLYGFHGDGPESEGEDKLHSEGSDLDRLQQLANMEAAGGVAAAVANKPPFTSLFLGPAGAAAVHLDEARADEFVLSSAGLPKEIEYTTIDLDSNLNLSCTDIKIPVRTSNQILLLFTH